MREERLKYLLEYMELLEQLSSVGYNCHTEIKRCIKEVEKELQIEESNKK